MMILVVLVLEPSMDRTLTVSGQAGISSNVYGYRFFATEYTPSATNELVTKNYLDNFQSSITVQKAVSKLLLQTLRVDMITALLA